MFVSLNSSFFQPAMLHKNMTSSVVLFKHMIKNIVMVVLHVVELLAQGLFSKTLVIFFNTHFQIYLSQLHVTITV